MHQIQREENLSWDKKLSNDQLSKWGKIVKQVNSVPEVRIKIFVGEREDQYKLITFSDSSKTIYGTVVYIKNLSKDKVNFLLARNKMVNKQLESKSISNLEFEAIGLGVETLIELVQELTGPKCVISIEIVDLELYTDSLVCLNWLNFFANKFDKMKNISVFVRNRLDFIDRLCEIVPIIFSFCQGTQNPADFITRPVSHNLLVKSNYYSGPEGIFN